MSATTTFYVDMQRLHSLGKNASTVVRLMMAANDISVANQCLSRFRQEDAPLHQHVTRGAMMYFINLQCGHLNEGLKVIDEIKNSRELHQRVEDCADFAKAAFTTLVECLDGGARAEDFNRYVERIRHNIAFHYQDKKLVSKALERRAERPDSKISRIICGSNISLWRFVVADDINDTIVCRYLWKIPEDKHLSEEADRIAGQGSEWAKAFLDFSGDFIVRYIRKNAAK